MKNDPIDCMVIARVSEKELDEIAQTLLRRAFSFETPRHSWALANGHQHAALISREPGGTGWHLAETISKTYPNEPVYSLWLDPEQSNIIEWRNGKQVRELPDSPAAFARSLGFEIDEATDPPPPPLVPSVAVIEAPIEDVRRALGARANEPWLHLESGPRGTVMSADDSNLGFASRP